MTNNNNLNSEQVADAQNDLDFLRRKTQKNLEQTESKIKKIIDCKINNHSCIIDDLREQEELSKLIVLFHRIERLYAKHKHNYQRLRELDIVFCSLQRAIEFSQILPKDETTRRIRLDIERVIYRQEYSIFGFISNLFMHVYRSKSVKIKIACGLLVSTGFATLALSSVLIPKSLHTIANSFLVQEVKASTNNALPHTPDLKPEVKFAQTDLNLIQENRKELNQPNQELEKKSANDFRDIIFVLASGTLGGVVSILTRLEKFNAQEFQNAQDTDPAVPFFVGAFKPIIAACFGLLIFALIQSNIVTIKGITTDEQDLREKTFFVCAIAFIIGFSERLAQDVIRKTEDTVVGDKNHIKKEDIEYLKNYIKSLDDKIKNLYEDRSHLSNEQQQN